MNLFDFNSNGELDAFDCMILDDIFGEENKSESLFDDEDDEDIEEIDEDDTIDITDEL